MRKRKKGMYPSEFLSWFLQEKDERNTVFLLATQSSNKQAHIKRGIAESLHVYITRARLCVRGSIFMTTLENTPTPSFQFMASEIA